MARPFPPPALRAAAAWAACWVALFALDGRLDLANLALLLVLGSTVASLWLPGWGSAAASTAAVAAFNWNFVPPRQAWSVDLRQHALLLATMLVVNWIVAGLVIRQRRLAEAAGRHAAREAQLRDRADALRAAGDPAAQAAALQRALHEASGARVAVLLDDEATLPAAGELDAERRAGAQLCRRSGQALGPGTGRYAEQPDHYLPLRAGAETLGAAVLVPAPAAAPPDAGLLAHLQALCDQAGVALQRLRLEAAQRRDHELAQQQAIRHALLAAVSHDLRTPLAGIMGAASSLAEQGERLQPAQRERLARGIVEEAERLGRLTDNALQLARLDAPDVALRRDWESAEEIVGAVLRRARRGPDGARLKARLEPGLPLLWCDGLLVAQLLDNLVDNALKYAPAGTPVELLVRRAPGGVLLAVRDRGPGIAPAWRERVFEVFERGPAEGGTRAGTGVGLAVCRAIAAAHGGTLRLRPRGHGGCAFELTLPLREVPPAAEAGQVAA